MKTKEQVLNHLLENGYNKKAISKITGFMVAKELKALDEVVKILKGDKSFEDFFKWYHSCETTPKEAECTEIEYCPCCVLETLRDDIARLIDLDIKYSQDELFDRHIMQMAFLLDLYETEDED